MARLLFVNLAVEDLDRSVAFFTELGFRFDPRFCDDTAVCMVVNERAYFRTPACSPAPAPTAERRGRQR